MAKLRYTITIETPFNPENYEGMGITTAEAAAAQEEASSRKEASTCTTWLSSAQLQG